MSPARTIAMLRRLDEAVGLAVGVLLLACVAFVLADVILRRVGFSLGGTDELSGYTMAAASSWGMAYALTALAHVRIDLLRQRFASTGRAAFDLLALATLAAVAVAIAWMGWGVLARSIANSARANTVLETPLWIPQALWWSGWLWFAVVTVALWIASAMLLARGDAKAVDAAIGARDEREEAE